MQSLMETSRGAVRREKTLYLTHGDGTNICAPAADPKAEPLFLHAYYMPTLSMHCGMWTQFGGVVVDNLGFLRATSVLSGTSFAL